MKILIIGSGGREHALAWKFNQSPHVSKIYVSPGNGGTYENVPIAANDLEGLLTFALNHHIDLTVVGPEEPLCMGIVDLFEQHDLRIFGPNKKCANLEKSKDVSKQFMLKHQIPTAHSVTVTSYDDAISTLNSFSYPVVIKADGLCLGKGVVICDDFIMAETTLRDIFIKNKFGEEGRRVLLETYLDGHETSLLCFVANNRCVPMQTARDYKKLYEGDLGPNTGGVGCYSPGPQLDKIIEEQISTILNKIENGLSVDGYKYNGILFVGLMIVNDMVYVLEFNVRFGDPETEVLLPRLETDLVDIIKKIENDTLQPEDLKWSELSCMTTVVTALGYPEQYRKEISINIDDSELIFHNGSSRVNNQLVSNGGRVLSFIELGDNLKTMNQKMNQRIDSLQFEDKQYRKDIGLR